MNPNDPQQPVMQPLPEAPTPMAPSAAPIGSAQSTSEAFPSQQKRNPNSSQNSLLISEIRENMLIMNDGSFRSVILCESINFDLMSSRERDAIEFSYQNFLNSLYFPVQIFIRSERVDIRPYLDKLVERRRSQDNMLLGLMMEDYINFIDILSREYNIMSKEFYVVVPYFTGGDLSALAAAGKNIFATFTKPQEQQRIRIDEATYEKAKSEMSNRVAASINGLSSMGVRAVALDTSQLGSLYYNVYNPDTAIREPLVDTNRMTGTYVQKGTGQPPAMEGY